MDGDDAGRAARPGGSRGQHALAQRGQGLAAGVVEGGDEQHGSAGGEGEGGAGEEDEGGGGAARLSRGLRLVAGAPREAARELVGAQRGGSRQRRHDVQHEAGLLVGLQRVDGDKEQRGHDEQRGGGARGRAAQRGGHEHERDERVEQQARQGRRQVVVPGAGAPGGCVAADDVEDKGVELGPEREGGRRQSPGQRHGVDKGRDGVPHVRVDGHRQHERHGGGDGDDAHDLLHRGQRAHHKHAGDAGEQQRDLGAEHDGRKHQQAEGDADAAGRLARRPSRRRAHQKGKGQRRQKQGKRVGQRARGVEEHVELARLQHHVPARGGPAGGGGEGAREAKQGGSVGEAEDGAHGELGGGARERGAGKNGEARVRRGQQRLGHAGQQDGADKGAWHGAGEGGVVEARGEAGGGAAPDGGAKGEDVVGGLDVEGLLDLGVGGEGEVEEDEAGEEEREEDVCEGRGVRRGASASRPRGHRTYR